MERRRKLTDEKRAGKEKKDDSFESGYLILKGFEMLNRIPYIILNQKERWNMKKKLVAILTI